MIPKIQTLPFERTQFDRIRLSNFGDNWPVVYLLENKKEIYIGESTHLYNRSKQHYDKNPERRKLDRIHIIADEEYNKSATLDIESLLIQYMAAEGSFILQNGNKGVVNHNYYDRDKYKAKFETLWKELQEMKIVNQDLIQIRNSDLFKYSPYKALTGDQLEIENRILGVIKSGEQKTIIVNGEPGTGKTIVATHLFKLLGELKETKDKKVGLVVPMTSLRSTLKKVFKNIKGLKASMVIGPSEVVNGKYDILIVDEVHRLRRRKNITNFQAFDINNKKLELGNNGDELDWIIKSSDQQILFYDKNQSVRPSDVRHDKFSDLNTMEFELKTQLRISAGEEGQKYLDFVHSLFDSNSNDKQEFSEYDFKIYDNIGEMHSDIIKKNNELTLCRMVSGYAWPWISKKNPDKHDIEIGGTKLFWNSVNSNWVDSPNAINEVGCIHTVQGYDLNYAGVIIGPELSYDPIKKKLVIHSEKYMDSNGKRGVDDPKELERYIINIYKTLLTRGIQGTYVYIVDEGLRKYFKDKVIC